jgi:ribonuclease HI
MHQVYTDGAVRIANPGLASAAFVVYNDDGTTVYEAGRVLSDRSHTNNEAEYQAVIDFLLWAEAEGVRKARIHCDSNLVVQQMRNLCECNNLKLKRMNNFAVGLAMRGQHSIVHVHGHSGFVGNERADALCNERLDQWINDPKNMPRFNQIVFDMLPKGEQVGKT